MSERKLTARGIIKWHPFASINDPLGFADVVADFNNATIKPELSEDQIEEYNLLLYDAFENKKILNIYYFSERKIEYLQWIIEQIDVIQHELIINGTKLSLDNLVRVEYV